MHFRRLGSRVFSKWHVSVGTNNIFGSSITYPCFLLLISMLWHRQAIFESKGDKLFSSAECRIRTQGLRHQIASRLNARCQTDWATQGQLKTSTRQPVPMISEHSTHSNPLLVGFRTWWRHQMETISALLVLCAGNSSVTGEFPSQRPVKRSFDVFFHLRLNKRLSKQSWGCWFETAIVSIMTSL